MSMALSHEIIRDRNALAAIEPDWRALWERASAATPFQSPQWLLPWWDAFSPGELAVAAVRCGSQLVALAPFYLERGPYGRRLLPIGISVSDYLDVLIDDAHPDLALEALAEAYGQDHRWDSWELCELLPDARGMRLPFPPGCDQAVETCAVCPVIALTSDRALWSRKRQQSLNCARNRAARRGVVTIVEASPANAGALLDELMRLHQARWTERGEPGVFADPQVGTFHRDAVPRLLAAGLLRLEALVIGGAVAAASYALVHRDRVYHYLTGFDAAFAFESPGALLLEHAILRARAEGAREFHLLRGNEAYKYASGAEDRLSSRRVFRRRSTLAEAS